MLNFEDGTYFEYGQIGEFHSDGMWIHPTRTLASNVLIFVLDGEVYLRENENQYALKKDDMIILESGKEHGGYKKSNAAFYWMHFYTDIPLPFKTHSGGEINEIKQKKKKLLQISNTLTYSRLAFDTMGSLIFQELLQLKNADDNAKNSMINKISEYIRINIDKKLSVTQIAEHFGYNHDYISKFFKKNTGIGIKEYIMKEKIKLAKDLLLTTNLSSKEISAKLGFESENNFIKFFVYHEKISPSKFRNTYFNTHMNKK